MATTQAAAPPITAAELRRRPSRASTLLRTARKKPVGAVSAIICILLILIAVFADVLVPHPPDDISNPYLQGPSLSYPFGTDNLFRDVFSRIIIGSRISLGIGFTAVFLGTILGTTLGLISGYFQGKTDLVVSRAEIPEGHRR